MMLMKKYTNKVINMNFTAVTISILLSLFSTIVMSYVALATPIGPWIAPTLVFIALLCSKLCSKITSTSMAYAVSAGSVGGIMATACAFSFPTIYFLDPTLFNEWMQSPFFFSGMLGIFSFLAGAFGLFVADMSEKTLIVEQNLSFPIGQMVHKMIMAQQQIRKAYELMAGFCTSALFSLLQGGVVLAQTIIPKTITLFSASQWWIFAMPRMVVNLDIAPMVWAIGFVTGHVIALPLAIGALANIFLVNPVQRSFFAHLSATEFTLAFCSGIVLFITMMSVIGMPQQIINGIKNSMKKINNNNNVFKYFFDTQKMMFSAFIAIALIVLLSYFQFPLHVQLYLVICSAITTYQIAAIAGRIGLALLGRFATFVMVPAMLIFNLNYVHIVFIATFVEMSGGVAADVLFGRKLAQLSDISHAKMRQYQLLGLVIASASIGIIFWLLINHFGLGSPELFAYRAQSRQLLIQAKQFDYIVLMLGGLFGMILQSIKLNPMLVLGGLLMPLDMTLGLVFGGLLAALARDKEELYPFWSGIFAGNSICMLLRAII
jgi:hypothetical protein